MDPVAFQTKWRTASANLKERTASKSHFNDLCALVGVQNPIEADPVGDTYTFERGAQKAGGGDGWADVWYKGRFAWEYKGIGRDLEAAYVQLLKYKDALENRPCWSSAISTASRSALTSPTPPSRPTSSPSTSSRNPVPSPPCGRSGPIRRRSTPA
ncbi:MAG: hypothetical protein WBA63_14430 [Thermomicrobiales bacterium]